MIEWSVVRSVRRRTATDMVEGDVLSGKATAFLERVAPRYIWWKTPVEAMLHPDRLIAQVMDLGTYEDVQELVRLVDSGRLREVLIHAEAGWFRPRSWSYWHYRLRLTEPGADPPPMPARDLGAKTG